MRWIRYEANGKPTYGILEGDTVVEVTGDPFAGYEKTTTRRPFSSVKLLVPVQIFQLTQGRRGLSSGLPELPANIRSTAK